MDEQLYETLAELEGRHWWFANRRRLAVGLFEKFSLELPRKPAVLDVGCGMGLLLSPLSQSARVYGLDPSPRAVRYCRDNFSADVRLGGLPDAAPFSGQVFDFIACMDVLEHVDEDARALSTMRGMLRSPNSMLLLTVPACRYLWGETDVIAHHKRRYGKTELYEKIKSAGYEIERLTYFNSFLFPPIALFRALARALHKKPDELRATPGLLNALLDGVFHLELRLLHRVNFPVGVSLLAVCRKGT